MGWRRRDVWGAVWVESSILPSFEQAEAHVLSWWGSGRRGSVGVGARCLLLQGSAIPVVCLGLANVLLPLLQDPLGLGLLQALATISFGPQLFLLSAQCLCIVELLLGLPLR